MTDWPKQSEVDSFYGNPRGQNGGPSILWEKRNLVTIPCPWKLFTAWDTRMEVKRIRIHGKCADSLTRVLAQAWDQSGKKQEAMAALPTELLELSNLVGPAGLVKERIAAYREAGVTHLQVMPVGPDPVGQIAAIRELVDA